MSIYKTGKRKYYKYESWTQPVNPSGITATSGWGNPKNAFDGSDGTYATCGTTSDYIEWDLGTDILLSGITANGQHVTNTAWASNITVKSVDSSGKETKLGTTTGTTTGAYTVRCTFSETKVNKLRFYLSMNDQGSNPSTSTKTRIKEIKLTATQQVVEATADDYAYSVVETDKIKDLYKSTDRKYYKYGTELNATVNGTFAKIDKGVASGFSASNFISTPETFYPDDNPWEMLFRVKTGTDITTTQYFIGRNETNKLSPLLGIYNGSWTINLSSDNKTWDIVSQPSMSHTIKTNTWYVVKFGWDGSTYYLKTSEDNGVSFTDSWSVDSKAKVIPASLRIGAKLSNNSSAAEEPFLGSIDLSQSYININGSRWWSGDSYTKVGSWIDDGVVGSFTTANYLTLPKTLTVNSNSWELCFKFKINSAKFNGLFGYTGTGLVKIFVDSDNKFTAALGNSADSFNAGTIKGNVLSLNTWCWVKLVFTGSAYELYESIDGIDYSLTSTIKTSTTSLFPSVTQFGYTRDGAFDGSIDFSQSYIKINDELWWYGTKVIETTPDDADYSLVPAKQIVAAYKTGKMTYYKDGVEVPVETITDFGHYKYYKDVVTTKYWKEITTGGRELAYACYKFDNYEYYWYAKAPVGSDKTLYVVNDNGNKANNPSELKSDGTLSSVTENEAILSLGGGFGDTVYKRYKEGDLYIDTTVTETVEGTPEDYTYTTEEIVKTEVSAGNDYDYTEFVPSTQFDSSETPTQLVYNLVKSYLKAADWNVVKESANTGVWGSDGSQYSIYSGTTTDNFTFKELQPAGKWTLTFAASQQYNFRYGTFKVTITYEDGTQGVVWNSNSIFPNGATAGGDYTISLTMEKKWKTISIYMATARAGENYCYGGHGKNRLTFYGNKQ